MRPIHHTFAPLADSAQRRLAFMRTFLPSKYRDAQDVRTLEDAIGKRYNGEVIAFGSGREALLAYLKALKLQPSEEVIVQGYTCVVVPNAIHAAGMVTVYADIERETLNLDLEAVEHAITPKTRAVICQHTFGIPANIAGLRAICDRHSLTLIEDCAHILPDHTGPHTIGAIGDAMLISFGRDKAISGISGGAILVRNSAIATDLRRMQQQAKDESLLHIFALLQYPLIYGIALPLYGSGIGKALLVAASKLKLLIPILTRREKDGNMPKELHRMPGACAALALQQWEKLQSINDHRRMLTALYSEYGKRHHWPMLGVFMESLAQTHAGMHALPLQKFPLFSASAERIRRTLKTQNIHLADGWTGCVVCPSTVDPDDAGYVEGLDPSAENVCEQILSLPTHPNMTAEQAHTLCNLLDPYLKPISHKL